MKELLGIHTVGERHWVGDGFPVRTIFSYDDLGAQMSPFLLMDYAGPAEFGPSSSPRGVGEHPHRGFETVTLVYAGDVEHRDSAGNGGIIGPGDVQWMTAGSGLVHEERHGRKLSESGGTLQMVQLWVNLRAVDKKAAPAYQTITDAQIPRVTLPVGAGTLRVIAGSYKDAKGPAQTFTPINLWDMQLKAGHRVELAVPSGHTTALFVLSGSVRLANGQNVTDAGLAIFGRKGEQIACEARQDSSILIMDGEPIDEPIIGVGPFVMNTSEEIHQAIEDYRSGRLGRLSAATAQKP